MIPSIGGQLPFVGRQRELAQLDSPLHRAVAGRGGTLLIAGEPGIGKTRLAHELAARANALGAAVLWGRCWEGDGAPAIWPWGEALHWADEPSLLLFR